MGVEDMVNDVKVEGQNSDWKEVLPSEIKDSAHIKNIESVEALAKSYVHASTQLSKNHPGPEKEDSFESFQMKTSKFFRLPEKQGEYKTGFEGDLKKEVEEQAFKYKLHPHQTKGFANSLLEIFDKNSKSATEGKVQGWKDETNKIFAKEEQKDVLLGKAFAMMGETRESLETQFGGLMHHPAINKLFIALGKSESSQKGSSSPISSQHKGAGEPLADKVSFIKSQLQNPKSAYFDDKHPDHTKTKTLFNQYVSEVQKFQRDDKSGSALNINLLA